MCFSIVCNKAGSNLQSLDYIYNGISWFVPLISKLPSASNSKDPLGDQCMVEQSEPRILHQIDNMNELKSIAGCSQDN